MSALQVSVGTARRQVGAFFCLDEEMILSRASGGGSESAGRGGGWLVRNISCLTVTGDTGAVALHRQALKLSCILPTSCVAARTPEVMLRPLPHTNTAACSHDACRRVRRAVSASFVFLGGFG